MHTIDDIVVFLNYYRENKLKVRTEHFLGAVGCVKNYQEFRVILDLFKGAGLKAGVRFYGHIVQYICSYEDCREILDYLKEKPAKVNREYFIQLMLLSATKEEARQVYNEFLNENTSTKLSESFADDFGNKGKVIRRFNEKVKHEYSKHGSEFRERIGNIKAQAFTGSEITETEKEYLAKSRIGQSIFKDALLVIEKKCRLCGVTDERFLVASHIKPWSQSNNQERLDVNNGLLLCPNHDALFDKGYISFDEDGTILFGADLDPETKVYLNINETMNIKMNKAQKLYMKWHRENLFKLKNGKRRRK